MWKVVNKILKKPKSKTHIAFTANEINKYFDSIRTLSPAQKSKTIKRSPDLPMIKSYQCQAKKYS